MLLVLASQHGRSSEPARQSSGPWPNGSRFWALGEEESSDEEAVLGEQKEVARRGVKAKEDQGDEEKFIQKILERGLAVDDIVRTGEHLRRNSWRKSKSLQKRANSTRAALCVSDSAFEQTNRLCNPWKGPLPKARISQQLTIGDKIAEALATKSSVYSEPATISVKSNQDRDAVSDGKKVFLTERPANLGSPAGELAWSAEVRKSGAGVEARGLEQGAGKFLILNEEKGSGPIRPIWLGKSRKVRVFFPEGLGGCCHGLVNTLGLKENEVKKMLRCLRVFFSSAISRKEKGRRQ